jgi:hypothetical protein
MVGNETNTGSYYRKLVGNDRVSMAKANDPKLVGRHQKLVGYDKRLESNEGAPEFVIWGGGGGGGGALGL